MSPIIDINAIEYDFVLLVNVFYVVETQRASVAAFAVP
jgi:hypothetical protein